jgi:hypothetical protein
MYAEECHPRGSENAGDALLLSITYRDAQVTAVLFAMNSPVFKTSLRCLLQVQQREILAALLRERPDLYRTLLPKDKDFKAFKDRYGTPLLHDCYLLRQLRVRSIKALDDPLYESEILPELIQKAN